MSRGMKHAPLFAPAELTPELSKTAWLDVAWNLAAQLSGAANHRPMVESILRAEMAIVVEARKAEYGQ